MRRRSLIAGLSATGVLFRTPSAFGQNTSVPVIGFLHTTSAAASQPRIDGLLAGLSAAGRSVGRNIAIEYRWANGDFTRLPKLAQELVRYPVAVLVTGAPSAAIAAKSATSTVPIVFVMGADPIKLGLVKSFSRPGTNVTGVAVLTVSLVTKRLQFIRSLMPDADVIGFVVNPSNPTTKEQLQAMQAAAQSMNQRLEILRVRDEGDIASLGSKIAETKAKALIIGADSFLISQSERLVAISAKGKLPAIYETRESVAIGGLASYAGDFDDGYRQAGNYVARILNGEQPADLPVVQPTTFKLSLNLRTAKSLGLAIPPTILAIADEVLE